MERHIALSGFCCPVHVLLVFTLSLPCFPGSQVGTELVCAPISFCERYCLVPGAMLLMFISLLCHFLVLVTCLVHFLCESEPQISALKISNILVSTSSGFAWISACQQGWPNFWLGLSPVSVVLFGGHEEV